MQLYATKTFENYIKNLTNKPYFSFVNKEKLKSTFKNGFSK